LRQTATSTLSRGIIAGFSASNLASLSSNMVPNRLAEVTDPYYLSSIWQSGYGPAADGTGNIYFSTGNSNPYTPSYKPTYTFPDSFLKVPWNLGRVLDSFTQYRTSRKMEAYEVNGAQYIAIMTHPDGDAFAAHRDDVAGHVACRP
jgi:hypothetical protein